jgi:hypothetical protein
MGDNHGDDTVRLTRGKRAAPSDGLRQGAHPGPGGAPRPAPRHLVLATLAALLFGSAVLGGVWLWRPQPEPSAPPTLPRADAPPRGQAPEAAATAGPGEATPAVALATEAEMLATTADQAVMLRLRDNPSVFVLLFPSLDDQGAALNRMAALVEKAGLPRDRLLDDAALARAIAQSGETPGTWYLGHDYEGADLARFFALADRDGIALNPGEIWVRARFAEARALVPAGMEIALVSVANAGPDLDPAMRATILHHEIGHGHFFTRPALRAHVLRVWRERFGEQDRQAIRRFLGREGYDTSNDVLMANEAMAYLLFTPDPRFFSPRHLGITEVEFDRLRQAMRDGLPQP